MIPWWALLVLFTGHWISDFVFQPDWMGKGKSTSWPILTNHAGRITVGMTAVATVIAVCGGANVNVGWILLYGLVNGLGHFVIDALTSRITGGLWRQSLTHEFFTVIGMDQCLHMMLAVGTMLWLT